MKNIFFFLLSINSLIAQDFTVCSGPFFGHFDGNQEHFWMMLKKSKNNQINFDESLENFISDYFYNKDSYKTVAVEKSILFKDNEVIVKGCLTRKDSIVTENQFSFLFGSCAFPYPLAFLSGKKKEKIFDIMKSQDKDFMLWLGDNTYYLFGDWNNRNKMIAKNIKMRRKPMVNDFLKSCRHYAIWDDHDFGPNDSGASYKYKDMAQEVFNLFWANIPVVEEKKEGVYYSFKHGRAEFFMLDARYFADDTTMLGDKQTKWLKNRLSSSTSRIKFIVSPTQFLPDNPLGEDLGDYGNSKSDLLNYIRNKKIDGVVILSGDRHYGEMMKMTDFLDYPLYEITSSPLTSFINIAHTKHNPIRIEDTVVMDQNFVKIKVDLSNQDLTILEIEMISKDGKMFWNYRLEL